MLPFLLTCLAVELTPGPNMAYLALLSSLRGRGAGFLMVGGIATGLFIVGTLCALGATSIFEKNPYMYQSLRWSGVAYMLWLAYDCWKNAAYNSSTHPVAENHFLRGLVTNLLNPKAFVFYITVLPSFAKTPELASTIPLTLGYVLVATMIHAILVILADRATQRLTNPLVQKKMAQIFAALLIIIAGWLAYHTRLPL